MLRYGLWVFLLAAAVQTGGCATAVVVHQIGPHDEGSDYVREIKAAHRDDAGNVTVCVTGMPDGMAWWGGWGGVRDYSLTFPAAASPELEVFSHKANPQYRITVADVKEFCLEPKAGWLSLPINSVRAEEFDSGNYSSMSDDALADFLASRAEAPAVYHFLYSPSWTCAEFMTIVYVHEEVAFDGARAVEITPWSRQPAARPVYALLLPFAVAFDVVTSPLQLLAVMLSYGHDG